MFREVGVVRLRSYKDAVGYKLVDELARLDDGREVLTQYIKPLSDPFDLSRRREVVAGLGQYSIFTELANTPETAEAALAFTRKWGTLQDSNGLFVSNFYRGRTEIAALIESASGGRGSASLIRNIQTKTFTGAWGGLGVLASSGLGLLKTHFEKGKLFFEAHSLLQFCVLECVHAVAGGVDISKCRGCGAYLRVSLNGRPPLYCGDACKQGAYRQKARSQPSSRAASPSACRACGAKLPPSLEGRPKVYCDDACKQSAYRLRLKSHGNSPRAKRPKTKGGKRVKTV
jgi:hypothetical protein